MNVIDLIPSPWRLGVALALSAALVAAGAGIGWGLNGWRLGAQVATVRMQAAEDKATTTAAALAQVRAANADRDAKAAQLAAVDKDYSAKLEAIESENNSLRDSVGRGVRVVRVNGATCPGAGGLPQTPARAGVDSGTGTVLTPEAGQTVLDLRAGLQRTETKLAACQAAVLSLQR